MDKLQRTDDYYFVQVFLSTDNPSIRAGYFVVFAKTKQEAERKSAEYCQKKWPNQVEKIHFYRRNYIYESRRLIETGNFC
jgi:hypothetical protein